VVGEKRLVDLGAGEADDDLLRAVAEEIAGLGA